MDCSCEHTAMFNDAHLQFYINNSVQDDYLDYKNNNERNCVTLNFLCKMGCHFRKKTQTYASFLPLGSPE